MPKVTEEHKEARREQILAGAQRAFASARLRGCHRREARGGDRPLPRRDLQLLRAQGGAVRRARALGRRIASLRSGWSRATGRCSKRAPDEDPEWLSVQVEAARRVRTRDERFRASACAARGQRRRDDASRGTPGCEQVTRGDVPIQVDRPVPRHARERRRLRAGDGRRDARSRPADDADRDRCRTALDACCTNTVSGRL